MAATPGFGGTNGVAELDLGQPGSARETAQTARYSVHVNRGPQDPGMTVHKLSEQPVSFVEHTGFAGQEVTWNGLLKVATMEVYKAIVSELSEYQTGQSIDANGNYGAVAPAKMKATKLTDYFGTVVAARATMARAVLGRVHKLSNDETYEYMGELTISFRVLA